MEIRKRDRVRGGSEAGEARARACRLDPDARVADGLKVPGLSRRACEVAWAQRTARDGGGHLSVAYGERLGYGNWPLHGFLVARLGVVAAVVEALIGGR